MTVAEIMTGLYERNPSERSYLEEQAYQHGLVAKAAGYPRSAAPWKGEAGHGATLRAAWLEGWRDGPKP